IRTRRPSLIPPRGLGIAAYQGATMVVKARHLQTLRLRLLAGLACGIFVLLLTSPVGAQPVAAKRPLRHGDYHSWRSIQGPQLSHDGKFVAYALVPQEADSEIVVRNPATGTEWRHSRGSLARSTDAPPRSSRRATGEMSPAPGLQHSFTADSRVLVFQIAPTKAETEHAKKAKKKPEEMPKNSLGIMDLATGQVTCIERVKSFQVAEEGAGFVAYHSEPKMEPKPEEEKPPLGPSPSPAERKRPEKKKKEHGSDLVLRNLADGSERVFPEVLEFSFSKDGKSLVYTIAAKQEENNGVYAVTPGNAAPPTPLLSGRGQYAKLTWDDKQTQLAFL